MHIDIFFKSCLLANAIDQFRCDMCATFLVQTFGEVTGLMFLCACSSGSGIMGILGLSKLIADIAPSAIKENEMKNFFGK